MLCPSLLNSRTTRLTSRYRLAPDQRFAIELDDQKPDDNMLPVHSLNHLTHSLLLTHSFTHLSLAHSSLTHHSSITHLYSLISHSLTHPLSSLTHPPHHITHLSLTHLSLTHSHSSHSSTLLTHSSRREKEYSGFEIPSLLAYSFAESVSRRFK